MNFLTKISEKTGINLLGLKDDDFTKAIQSLITEVADENRNWIASEIQRKVTELLGKDNIVPTKFILDKDRSKQVTYLTVIKNPSSKTILRITHDTN